MQIYIPHYVEAKLRIWCKQNNRTISSVVVEGLGNILITKGTISKESQNTDIPKAKSIGIIEKGNLVKNRGDIELEDYV